MCGVPYTLSTPWIVYKHDQSGALIGSLEVGQGVNWPIPCLFDFLPLVYRKYFLVFSLEKNKSKTVKLPLLDFGNAYLPSPPPIFVNWRRCNLQLKLWTRRHYCKRGLWWNSILPGHGWFVHFACVLWWTFMIYTVFPYSLGVSLNLSSVNYPTPRLEFCPLVCEKYIFKSNRIEYYRTKS